MESKVNYTLVGLFVLILGGALILLSLWLGAGPSKQLYNTYVTYMYQSVSGLNLSASVKYRGVDVGEVSGIALDPEDPERVRLLLDIEQGTPIKEDTVAILATQGITGIAFVELTGGTKESPLLRPRTDGTYPEIGSGPSLLMRMDIAVTELLGRLTEVSGQFKQVAQQVNRLLNEKNQQAVSSTLANLEQVTNVMGGRIDDLALNIDNVTQILNNTARVSNKMPQLVEEMSASMLSIQDAVATINRTATDFEDIVAGTQEKLIRATGDSMSEASLLLSKLRDLTDSLNRVVSQFERNPNMLLFGRRELSPGPGEDK